MVDIYKRLRNVDFKGLAPPQNWTTLAADEIQRLRTQLTEAKAEVERARIDSWNEAVYACQRECWKLAPRPHPDNLDGVGARNCAEIKDALYGLIKTQDPTHPNKPERL